MAQQAQFIAIFAQETTDNNGRAHTKGIGLPDD